MASRAGRSASVPEWKVALSAWVLRLEGWTARAWAPVTWILAGLALAVSGILPELGGWFHAAILLGWLAGLVLLLRRAWGPSAAVDRGRALRRLESVNGLEHRPLAALEDAPAGAGATERAVWEVHRGRMAERLRALRVGAPAPVLPDRDPFALRFLSLFALVSAGIAAGPNAWQHVGSALTPQLFAVAPASSARLDAWITPPAYTGQAPIFLTGQAELAAADPRADLARRTDALRVPAGSVLTAQISGGEGEPAVTGLGPEIAFEAFGQDAVRLEATLTTDVTLGLTRGTQGLGDWRIAVIPDAVPEIALSAPPAATPQFALEVGYRARDDYGLTEVGGRIARVAPPEGTDPDAVIDLPMVLRGAAPRESEMTSYHDLTAHPWAGLEVELTLFARDAADQEGTSAPHRFTLPERAFSHPVARAIVAQRKQLAADPLNEADAVAAALKAIGADGAAYGDDIAVYLALDQAARRARAATSADAFDPVYTVLWDVALHLEDGGLSLAQARLREAQRELMEAIARDAPPEELQRLMDEVERAMQEVLQAMQEQMQREMEAMAERGEDPPTFDPETMQMMDMQDLQSMMDQIREMMEAGLMEEAQQLLSQLQQMMENMQAGRMAQMSGEAMEGMQAMNRLQEMIRAQQELMERAFEEAQREMGLEQPEVAPRDPQSIRELLEQLMRERQNQLGQGAPQPGEGQDSQQGQSRDQMAGQNPGQDRPGLGSGDEPGRQGAPGPGAGAGRSPEQILQEALRRQLGDIMQRFGELTGDVPREFGRAERAMRESGEALGRGQPGESIDPQGRAIEELQNAARQAAQQLMQQMGQGQGPAMMQEQLGGSDPERHDPFGREPGQAQRGLNQSDVAIPEEQDLQRSREIRDELRRRSGERQRPEFELDYIDRLLEQFR